MAAENLSTGNYSLARRCRCLVLLWGLVGVLIAPDWGAATFRIVYEVDLGEYAMGLFEVYERNRQEGVPNFITEDVLLLSYGMIRVAVGKDLEREHYVGAVRRLVEGLSAQVAARQADEVNRANRDYLAVLTALTQGRDQVADAGHPPRAQAELDLVLTAKTLARSPLWGLPVDYTQFRPRGHYSGDTELERYFRTVRYAGTVLFAITASQATGVSDALADRMTAQAVRLARLIKDDADLHEVHQDLMRSLTWRIGPPEDLPNDVLLTLDAEPAETFRARLLAQAQEEGWQPRIISGVVDASRLEKDMTAADVMTGWRLLPQRYTPESAAFQELVFDGTGEFYGDREAAPFGLTLINGRAVKGFPLLGELMAMWGSQASSDQLGERGETAFEGYHFAREYARLALSTAGGLSALHQQVMQTGFQMDFQQPSFWSHKSRLTALRAFWTWQRYAVLLYAKQSYTVVGKGLELASPRPGALLEPSLPLYQALARVVAGHRRETPHPSWDAFAEILDRVIDVASRQLLYIWDPIPADEQFLNGLDVALTALTGGPDAPIVVDVHTNPASREVLQEATGKARLVAMIDNTNDGWLPRGARFTQCEFRHPMTDRLDDVAWRDMLASSPWPCGPVEVVTVNLADKLDADLIGLLEVYEASGTEGVQAYAAEHQLDLQDDQVEVTITAASADSVNALKARVADVGGTVETDFENALYATLPVAALERFVMQESVWRMDWSRQVVSPPGGTDADASVPAPADLGR